MIRHNFQPASAKSRPAGSGRDAVSPTVSEGSGLSSDNSQSNTRDEGQKTAKRRTQNRAAQRRFRERRDEQNKVLQEKAAELQAKYDALEEKYNLKTEQASQLQSENEGLQTEIQNLKQRWRTMILLLQRPQSLQFLSVLVGSEQAGLPPVDDLDGHLRCLDALLIPESKNT
ncbi:hypothetical protein BJY04DRAFT_185453 [Aspergillus karnatakaensis]|uniref:bZIP transcription factor n=1 Tax=Aspergillus karnatakaensis TaxID=1810916 RepID=UPI003CCE1DA0